MKQNQLLSGKPAPGGHQGLDHQQPHEFLPQTQDEPYAMILT
jgi:hypothetical protein